MKLLSILLILVSCSSVVEKPVSSAQKLKERISAEQLSLHNLFNEYSELVKNKQQLEAIKFLANIKNFDIFLSPFKNNILHEAIEYENPIVAKYILSLGVIDLRDKNTFDQTALSLAVANSSYNTARLLLMAKSPVDSVDSFGDTPLIIAAGNNNLNLVRLLLEYNAEPSKYSFTNKRAIDVTSRKEIKELIKSYEKK